MKKISIIVLLALCLGLVSCHPKIKEHTNDKNEKLLFSTLYIQQAAEYKALCYQAYNLGQVRLDAILKNHKGNKKLAIVVDVDETVLNNSPFEAKSILEKTSYPTFWKEWCEQIDAESIAGAQEFLSYAAFHKVETFYVTNRKIELYDATLQNLRKNLIYIYNK